MRLLAETIVNDILAHEGDYKWCVDYVEERLLGQSKRCNCTIPRCGEVKPDNEPTERALSTSGERDISELYRTIDPTYEALKKADEITEEY